MLDCDKISTNSLLCVAVALKSTIAALRSSTAATAADRAAATMLRSLRASTLRVGRASTRWDVRVSHADRRDAGNCSNIAQTVGRLRVFLSVDRSCVDVNVLHCKVLLLMMYCGF